jgi:hypothetical protein
MGKYLRISHILGGPSSYMTLHNCSTLNFLIYEENFILFFISVYNKPRQDDQHCIRQHKYCR